VIWKKIQDLTDIKKLKGRDGYRIRVGNYRVIYEIIDTQLIVDVISLGHGKDIDD